MATGEIYKFDVGKIVGVLVLITSIGVEVNSGNTGIRVLAVMYDVITLKQPINIIAMTRYLNFIFEPFCLLNSFM